jgi:hypothetical protein
MILMTWNLLGPGSLKRGLCRKAAYLSDSTCHAWTQMVVYTCTSALHNIDIAHLAADCQSIQMASAKAADVVLLV